MHLSTPESSAKDRISSLRQAIEGDIRQGLYYGAVVKVTHRDETLMYEAVGAADRGAKIPLQVNSVFSIFSITKAFVNALVLHWIAQGRLALTTRVSEVIPEFSGAPRDRATLFHLLTHTAGMPGVWEIRPEMYLDRLDELVAAVCSTVHGVVEPGTRCDYAPMVNHILMAEMLRRTDPQSRGIADLLREELFEPLGMLDTSMGIRHDLKSRHVVPDMRGMIPVKALARDCPGDFGLFEQERVEAPHVGCASTVEDLSRFVAMLHNSGTLGNCRLLSPRLLSLATQNWTAELPNELYRTVALRAGYDPPPAYLGLGFCLRGTRIVRHQFGTLTSPQTFGNYGSGTSVYWVDPALEITFVCLTAGVMSQAANIDRFQRLADLTVCAIA